jgi:hypothetical protein
MKDLFETEAQRYVKRVRQGLPMTIWHEMDPTPNSCIDRLTRAYIPHKYKKNVKTQPSNKNLGRLLQMGTRATPIIRIELTTHRQIHAVSAQQSKVNNIK